MNFQITVSDSEALALAQVLGRAGVELFVRPETKWYGIGEEEAGVHQFLV